MNTEKPTPEGEKPAKKQENTSKDKEIGGFENKPEPTRYGDWDVNGRCSDF